MNKLINKINPIHIVSISLLAIIIACSDNSVENTNRLPVLSTAAVTEISSSYAVSGGVITSEGAGAVTARGVSWGTQQNPTISDNKTNDGQGIGSFTSLINGLSPDTKYFVRAYATNSEGTAYGGEVVFVSEKFNLTDDLIAYWNLDENSGEIANDALGSWHLDFINSPSWSADGKINSAVDFGMTTARYLEKKGVMSGNRNTYTLSAWVYLTSDTADAKNILGINSGAYIDNAGAAEVKLYIAPDNKFVASYHASDGSTNPMFRISAATIPLNTWTHLVGVINNGNVELYINGNLDDGNAVTNPTNSNLFFNNGRATLGNARLWRGNYIATRWFRGKIDEAAIWARALSAEEVKVLYSNGNGLQYPF